MLVFIVCAGWDYSHISLINAIHMKEELRPWQWIPLHLLFSIQDFTKMWVLNNREQSIFLKWHWSSFLILLAWCIGQNLLVELFLYYDQLGEEIYNPLIFEFNGRSVMFQTHLMDYIQQIKETRFLHVYMNKCWYIIWFAY